MTDLWASLILGRGFVEVASHMPPTWHGGGAALSQCLPVCAARSVMDTKTGCNVSTDRRKCGWELAVWAKGKGKHVRILPNVCLCDGIMDDFKYFPVMRACYFYNEKMEIS